MARLRVRDQGIGARTGDRQGIFTAAPGLGDGGQACRPPVAVPAGQHLREGRHVASPVGRNLGRAVVAARGRAERGEAAS